MELRTRALWNWRLWGELPGQSEQPRTVAAATGWGRRRRGLFAADAGPDRPDGSVLDYRPPGDRTGPHVHAGRSGPRPRAVRLAGRCEPRRISVLSRGNSRPIALGNGLSGRPLLPNRGAVEFWRLAEEPTVVREVSVQRHR